MKTVKPHCKKSANPQMANLIFADTQANAKKPKEPFFSNARIIKYDQTN
jgi:hypothetical protein